MIQSPINQVRLFSSAFTNALSLTPLLVFLYLTVLLLVGLFNNGVLSLSSLLTQPSSTTGEVVSLLTLTILSTVFFVSVMESITEERLQDEEISRSIQREVFALNVANTLTSIGGCLHAHRDLDLVERTHYHHRKSSHPCILHH